MKYVGIHTNLNYTTDFGFEFFIISGSSEQRDALQSDLPPPDGRCAADLRLLGEAELTLHAV